MIALLLLSFNLLFAFEEVSLNLDDLLEQTSSSKANGIDQVLLNLQKGSYHTDGLVLKDKTYTVLGCDGLSKILPISQNAKNVLTFENSTSHFSGVKLNGLRNQFIASVIKSDANFVSSLFEKDTSLLTYFYISDGYLKLSNVSFLQESNNFLHGITSFGSIGGNTLLENSYFSSVNILGNDPFVGGEHSSSVTVKNCVFTNITHESASDSFHSSSSSSSSYKYPVTYNCIMDSNIIKGGENAYYGSIVSGIRSKHLFSHNNTYKSINNNIKNIIYNNNNNNNHTYNQHQDITEGDVTFEDDIFENITAAFNGGALYIGGNDYTANLTRCNFKICSAENAEDNTTLFRGGAIDVDSDTITLIIDDCEFNTCVASQDGGALYLICIFTISSSNFTNCSIFGDNCEGGAIKQASASSASSSISKCFFTSCSAPSGVCGGVCLYSDHITTTLSECSFINCTAKKKAGAVYVAGSISDKKLSHIFIDQCTFNDSKAEETKDGLRANDILIAYGWDVDFNHVDITGSRSSSSRPQIYIEDRGEFFVKNFSIYYPLSPRPISAGLIIAIVIACSIFASVVLIIIYICMRRGLLCFGNNMNGYYFTSSSSYNTSSPYSSGSGYNDIGVGGGIGSGGIGSSSDSSVPVSSSSTSYGEGGIGSSASSSTSSSASASSASSASSTAYNSLDGYNSSDAYGPFGPTPSSDEVTNSEPVSSENKSLIH